MHSYTQGHANTNCRDIGYQDFASIIFPSLCIPTLGTAINSAIEVVVVFINEVAIDSFVVLSVHQLDLP